MQWARGVRPRSRQNGRTHMPFESVLCKVNKIWQRRIRRPIRLRYANKRKDTVQWNRLCNTIRKKHMDMSKSPHPSTDACSVNKPWGFVWTPATQTMMSLPPPPVGRRQRCIEFLFYFISIQGFLQLDAVSQWIRLYGDNHEPHKTKPYRFRLFRLRLDGA